MAEEPELFGDEERTPSPFAAAVEEAGERRGIGRPKGATNRKTADFEKLYYARGYRDPLLVLGELISADPRALQALTREDAIERWDGEGAAPKGVPLLDVVRMQIAAAGELAPYLHGKMPTRIEIADERLPTLIIVSNSNQLEEAQQLLAERQALSLGAPLIEGEASETPANPGLSEGDE